MLSLEHTLSRQPSTAIQAEPQGILSYSGATPDIAIDEKASVVAVPESVSEYVYPEGGYGWVVLGCCMTFAALTMGWGVSWGVFQTYYKESVYPESTTQLSLVGGIFGLCLNTTSFISGRWFQVCLLASIVTLAMWLTAHSYNAVIAFAVVYGLISPTYLSLIPVAAAKIFGSENLASNVGICLLLTAPGALGGGPVGGSILSSTGEWKWLIIYGALVQAVAGISALVWGTSIPSIFASLPLRSPASDSGRELDAIDRKYEYYRFTSRAAGENFVLITADEDSNGTEVRRAPASSTHYSSTEVRVAAQLVSESVLESLVALYRLRMVPVCPVVSISETASLFPWIRVPN
ncbi:hypothetical protein P7C73_g5739, partial [Tremellales sp. Uapishka_1]